MVFPLHINVCGSGGSISLLRCLQKKFGITSSLGSVDDGGCGWRHNRFKSAWLAKLREVAARFDVSEQKTHFLGMNCLKTNVQTSGTLLLVIAAWNCDDAAWINFTRISTVCLEDHFSYDLGHPGTYPFLCSEARGKLSNRLKVQTFADWMEFRAPQFRVQSDLKRGSNAYISLMTI